MPKSIKYAIKKGTRYLMETGNFDYGPLAEAWLFDDFEYYDYQDEWENY